MAEQSDAWKPIETAPRPTSRNQPAIPILLAWFDLTTGGERAYSVGEGYWHPESGPFDGDWWWANTSPGDDFAAPIQESIAGRITHWQALPDPPDPVTAHEAGDA